MSSQNKNNSKSEGKGKTVRVLWIDDEPIHLQSIADKIAKQLNVSFDFAGTAAFGLKKLVDNMYDAIIVDIFLPRGYNKLKSVEVDEILEKYGDRNGLGILEILTNGIFDDLAKKANFLEIPIIITSELLMSALMQNDSLSLHISENVMVVGKSDFFENPDALLDILQGIHDPHHLNEIEASGSSRAVHQRKIFRLEDHPIIQLPTMMTRILHDNHNMLLNVEDTIKKTLEYLATDNTGPIAIPSVEDIERMFRRPATKLLETLVEFWVEITPVMSNREISAEIWSDLETDIDDLSAFVHHDPAIQIPDIRRISQSLIEISYELQGQVPKTRLKQIRGQAFDLEKYVHVYNLYHSWTRLKDMERRVVTFTGYITANVHIQTSQHEVFPIGLAIEQAVNGLAKYLESKRVKLRFFKLKEFEDFVIKGVKKDIKRAIENIINNAIEYSRVSIETQMPTVNISLELKLRTSSDLKIGTNRYHQYLILTVENIGVPIDKEEIEKDLIFREGYIGKYVSMSGNAGSGVGLSDVRQIMRNVGKVKIESEPIPYTSAGKESQLNRTKVILEFPLERIQETFDIEKVVQGAIENIQDYAQKEKVEIRYYGSTFRYPMYVKGYKQELQRAIENILDNGIKYSYTLDDGRPWINVKCNTRFDNIYIVVESWGTPITQEEIDEGLIFENAYRGEFAQMHGRRSGSGIGLNYVMDVIKKHSGEVSVESKPASPRPNYQGPYLTTFTIKLSLETYRRN